MPSRSKQTTWLVWMLCILTPVGWSYKLSSKLNKTDPDMLNVSDVVQNLSGYVEHILVGEMQESDFVLPDMEKKGDESSETGEKGGGMGELGRSLEFLMLKVAQLETLAEMQQALIGKLLKKIGTDDAEVSMAQKTSEESMPEAHDVLQRVLQKHAHQREHREYHPEAHQPKPNTEEAEELEEDDEELEESPGEESPGPRRALLQKRENFFPGIPGGRRRIVPAPPIIPSKVPTKLPTKIPTKLPTKLPTKVPSVPGGLPSVPGGLPSVPFGVPGVPGLPNAPGVPDIPQLVAAAVERTVREGTFGANCPKPEPKLGADGAKIYINFGKWYCSATILGRSITLYDFDLGRKEVNVHDMLPPEFHDIAKAPSASCDNVAPSLGVDGTKLYVDFGRPSCSVSFLGRSTSFNLDWGRKEVDLPMLDMLPKPLRTLATAPLAVINAQMTLAAGISNCVNGDKTQGIIECLGTKIIQLVPPLSYLNRMSDILTEVIEVFARIAATVVEKAMEKGPSLVQTAATAKFPAAGEPPMLHYKGTNLIIESHTRQLPPPSRSWPPKEMAAVQTGANLSEAGDDPDGVITYEMGSSDDVHATKLITQFDGRETDTSSCLAFAPKNRQGDGVSKADWKVGNQNDFLQLEPWAVPCDNGWMKDNWNKWQGYTFYTQPSAIEKCVTVTFSLGMQPVVAFVGGLQFEILPKPLFELGTTVCWPNQQPGGVDLSVLRSEVKSAGILLFSRTLRLTKRFGHGTDFVPSNARGGYSTWRSNAGIAQGETTVPKDELSRTSFLETNQSHAQAEEEAETLWKTDSEDLYLASVDYGENLNTSVKKTFEAYGEEAAMHMGTEAGKEVFKLFSFKNPGLVNFKVEGLMAGNRMELGMEMAFGPYRSPPKRIPLVDIAHQFSLILSGIPFVSSRSKLKAIAALRDFSIQDVGKARGLPMKPGSVIGLYSPHCRRFLQVNGDGKSLGVTGEMKGHGFPDWWTWQQFTVVDAGNGQIALHNAIHNRFVGTGGVSPVRNAHELPSDWGSERFTVVDVGNGEIAFYNEHHKRFLNMAGHGAGFSDHPPHPPKLPTTWTWERFRMVPAERILVPGSTIALHSQLRNRFVKMHGGALERSPENGATEMPDWWTWERFTVVDAGHGQYALHNAVHNRFVGVGAASPHRLVDQLPGDWGSEKWDAWPAGNGQIVLHNRHHNRMLRMSGDTVDFSSHMDPKQLPDDWTWERFQVVHLKPYLQPGTVVALRCPHHGRYIKMLPGAPSALLLARENHSQNETFESSSGWFGSSFGNILKHANQAAQQAAQAAKEVAEKAAREAAEQAAREAALRGTIGVSPHMDDKNFPDDWTWERFTVVDAGNGQVAFHNSIHNRYLKMHGDRMLVSPPQAPDTFPSNWGSERFTVLPAGHGQFMFHNSGHNRMIRMTGDKVDASAHMNPQDMPGDWTWERFQIVPVRPYLQPGTVVALHCAVHNRYVSMNGAALQRSAEMGVNDLPAWWDWERFTVVDAGNGQVAFHNAFHNRFLEMRGATMGSSAPHAVSDLQSWWTWQRFTVVPAGDGQFVFHNTLHNRMIRMSSSTMDSSGHKSPQDLPHDWGWERFRIVQVSEASETAQKIPATFD